MFPSGGAHAPARRAAHVGRAVGYAHMGRPNPTLGRPRRPPRGMPHTTVGQTTHAPRSPTWPAMVGRHTTVGSPMWYTPPRWQAHRGPAHSPHDVPHVGATTWKASGPPHHGLPHGVPQSLGPNVVPPPGRPAAPASHFAKPREHVGGRAAYIPLNRSTPYRLKFFKWQVMPFRPSNQTKALNRCMDSIRSCSNKKLWQEKRLVETTICRRLSY